MNPRLAHIISTVGNPFLLFPLVVSYLAVQEVGLDAAWPMMMAMAVIFGLLGIFLLLRKSGGKITNLDVSDQKQRALNVYLPSIGLILLGAGYFYWTEQPYVWRTLYVALLLGTCFAINAFKKISLHTVVATYLSALLLTTQYWVGLVFFGIAFLIAWSRVVLGRHTRQEVLLGWVVGTLFGLLQAWIFQ